MSSWPSPAPVWPAIDVGRIANAENATFGDLDGDSHLDIVVAHGVGYTRRPAGLAILWGEAGPRWHDAGDLPASRDRGHWLTVRVTDLDGDGDADMVAGGRASRPAGGPREASALAGLTWAGLRWFANPGPAAARDLAAWTVHDIDPTTLSGHGFALGDVDGDGDIDIANGNADWDTPDEAENVVWYEHPGPHALRAPWPGHELYRGSEFIGKEQVVIADLDGDASGRPFSGWNKPPPAGIPMCSNGAMAFSVWGVSTAKSGTRSSFTMAMATATWT